MKVICHQPFAYRPSYATNVFETLQRAGFKPTTDAEREARHAEQVRAERPARVLRVAKR